VAPDQCSALKLASPLAPPLASPLEALPPPAEPPGGPSELVELVITSLLLSTCTPGVVTDEALRAPVPELEVPELLLEALASDVALADSCTVAVVFGGVAT
jgi:hypothetical protein